jgi:opacity protein-like surface antigen
MKKSYIAAVSALAVMLSAALPVFAQTSPVPACPTVTGAYYLQGSSWAPMDPSHSSGFKTTNIAAAAFSYGAAKAQVKAQFRDPKSPYQLGSNTLAICLVGVMDSGRDVVLAKLQEEKDRRELAMASYRMWTGVNAQIDPKAIIPTTVEKKGDKVYLVTSTSPLTDGEFILFTLVPDVAALQKANTPSSLGGYDIGCHSR